MSSKRKITAVVLAFALAFCIVIVSAITGSGSKYNDVTYRSYANLVEDSDIPSLFRNDSVFASYKKYPPVISDGIEYVPVELFQGLPNVKISYSNDESNFYIQNKNSNKYISFSIRDKYAVTGQNKVYEVEVPTFFGVHYVPLRIVCTSTGIGCDTYNDGENKIYVIKVYTTPGLSAKELIQIHAPQIYSSQPDSSGTNSGTDDKPQITYKPGTIMLFYFSDGFSNAGSTLNTLLKQGIKATFFVTEQDIATYPDTIRRIYAEGHTLGLDFSKESEEVFAEGVLEEKINSAEKALYETAKTKTRLLYLPDFEDEEIKARIDAMGLCTVKTNLDSETGKYSGTTAFTRLNNKLKDIPRNCGSDVAYIKMSHNKSGNSVVASLSELVRANKPLKMGVYDETMSQ
ncbi:MAG: polysaccharide deacetylase family protein [Clostridia bacterium]|nr:polysaccharide deacetylase family protein [Clostridia bacterium]